MSSTDFASSTDLRSTRLRRIHRLVFRPRFSGSSTLCVAPRLSSLAAQLPSHLLDVESPSKPRCQARRSPACIGPRREASCQSAIRESQLNGLGRKQRQARARLEALGDCGGHPCGKPRADLPCSLLDAQHVELIVRDGVTPLSRHLELLGQLT